MISEQIAELSVRIVEPPIAPPFGIARGYLLGGYLGLLQELHQIRGRSYAVTRLDAQR